MPAPSRKRLRTVALGIALLVTWTAHARADIVPEREPNGSPAQAQPLLPPASVGGAISVAGETDLFSFRLAAGQAIKADVLARGFRAGQTPGSSLTARLRILDVDGVSILAEDVSQGDFDDPAVTAYVSQDGTYYAAISDVNGTGGAAHRYVLSLEIDDNGTFATATRIEPPVLVSIDALIWPAGDHDVYAFDATAGRQITVDLDSAVFNPGVPPIKGVLSLYDAAHSLMGTDAFTTSDPVDPFIQVTAPSTATYYVEVRELRSFVGNDAAYYQLSVIVEPPPNDDSLATSIPLAVPRSASGTICPSSDRDHAAFTLPSSGVLHADVEARESLQSLLEGALSLYTPGGALLASSSSVPDPAIVASEPAGSYVSRLEGFSSGLCEDAYYRLWLDADLDGDGVYLPADRCPSAADPGQADQDGDGVGDACDICVAVFNPGQEHPLRVQTEVGDTLLLSESPSGTSLTWSLPPDGVASNVYRAAVTSEGSAPSFTCVADNSSASAFLDRAVPPARTAFFYVVTAENCGESGAGTGSAGQPRSIQECPAPI